MRNFLVVIFTFISIFGYSRMMDIGILRHVKTKRVNISYLDGGYEVWADSSLVFEIYKGKSVRVKSSGGKVNIKSGDKNLGSYTHVRFVRKRFNASFRIKATEPAVRERKYHGDLTFTVEDQYALKIVNNVPINYYLAGVVESESGAYQTLEYYKVQATISRTYALKHIEKCKKEGFMLNDLVSCQVYKNKSRYNPDIMKAVELTEGLVITDSTNRLISAAFYSNSGGQTSNPQDVWNKPVPYLKSIVDTFSVGSRNYRWQKEFGRKYWLDYLKENYQYPIHDSTARADALNFQQVFRKGFFVHPHYGVPLRDIRRDLRLKSTYFSVFVEGDRVVLRGKGFGHGVGLSQEGAMKMAKLGYKYDQIVKFYFTGVKIVDFDSMQFFADE